jgi:hypothetical protein
MYIQKGWSLLQQTKFNTPTDQLAIGYALFTCMTFCVGDFTKMRTFFQHARECFQILGTTSDLCCKQIMSVGVLFTSSVNQLMIGLIRL